VCAIFGLHTTGTEDQLLSRPGGGAARRGLGDPQSGPRALALTQRITHEKGGRGGSAHSMLDGWPTGEGMTCCQGEGTG